jgi:hypothetical protein
VLYLPALGEKEEAAEMDRDRIEEIKQTLFDFRGEVGVGRLSRLLYACSCRAQSQLRNELTWDRLRSTC